MPADVAAIIVADAPAYGLDPYAALAVTGTEGGTTPAPGHYDPDTLGHPGWSYGPWQLRSPGALPIASSGQYGPGYDFAWSRRGIDYALQKMSEAGAKGKKGPAAIDAIVRDFERPAHPDAEVQRAVALYHVPAGGNVSAPGSSSSAPTMHAGGTAQDASLTGSITGIPGDVWNGITGAIGGVGHDVAAPFEAIAGFFTPIYDILTSQNTWIRVALFAGGLVVIVAGLKYALAPNVTPIPV